MVMYMQNFFNQEEYLKAEIKLQEAMRKEKEQALRKYFGNKIKQNFLIEMLHKVMDSFGSNIFAYYNSNVNAESIVTGEVDMVDYEICRMIVGLHRSNTIFMDDSDRVSLEKDDKYKAKLVESIIEEIKLRRKSAVFFRRRQLMLGDELIFFPVPYRLFVMTIKSLELINENSNGQRMSYFYFMIFNKALATLSLIEDNFLDNGYPICRLIIELYVKLHIVELIPGLLEEHDLYVDYDRLKTCCGQEYPEEFETKFINRKNQRERSKIAFLHYGWVDSIDDYHKIVTRNPYSIDGLISYLKVKVPTQEIALDKLQFFHKMCHSYTHGNVGYSKYALLHYFELCIILGTTIPRVYELLCMHLKIDKKIDGLDIEESFCYYFEKMIQQYNKRSTENFDAYYKEK